MVKSNIIPSSVQRELSIRSESVQRIYNFYVNNLFYVNRRYQRKLVWNIEEKRAFVDSILQGFPVPIILLAQTEKDKKSVFEIIDGMQRLNAITSFIEGEFDIDCKYFDLQTMVESKSRLDQEKVSQKIPILERNYCETIASYIREHPNRLQGSLDNFYRWIIQKIQSQPIDQTTKDAIGREIKIVRYKDKSVIIFRLKAGQQPIAYKEKFYQRIGANVDEIEFSQHGDLFE